MKNKLSNTTFNIHTIGCKTNQCESDEIARILISHGFNATGINSNPDIVIINTCTVTSAADRKVRQFIRRVKTRNSNTEIIVTGCYTVFNKPGLKNLGADLIIPNEDKEKIPGIIIKEKNDSFLRVWQPGKEIQRSKSMEDDKACDSLKPVYPAMHSRALVKIQDGCQQSCSYCIVPFVRGQYRSFKPGEVLEKVKYFISNGYDEVVFTGIHIGKYGIDLPGGPYDNKAPGIKNTGNHEVNLAMLIKNVLDNTDIKRIRLSSLEINEIDSNIIDIMNSGTGRVAPHLHIPLQSGSGKILKSMNRKYNYGFFKDTIKKLRNEIPALALTTDIIVGFPNETEEDFKDTLRAIKETDFSKTHVFKYSMRQHTAAINMDGHVDENIKSQRSRISRELGERLRDDYISKAIGKKLQVVCEAFDKKSMLASGTSENYLKVYFKINEDDFKLKKCKILEIKTEDKFRDGLSGSMA